MKTQNKKTSWFEITIAVIASVFVIILGSILIIEVETRATRIVCFSVNNSSSISESIDLSKLDNYESSYKSFNSYVYYSALTENERKVYHVFEYALDNAFPYVYLDSRIIKECCERYTPYEILQLLALDSPLLEQNLLFGSGEHFSFNNTSVEGERYYIENFSKCKLEKKELAIAEATKISDGILSTCNTDSQKARAIFEYLATSITYCKTEQSESNYLYDALIGKSTLCDGYANAYSVLAHLVGLDCFEKYYASNDNEPGHIWNAVKLDNVWYNVDSTISADSWNGLTELSKECNIYKCFGFGDDQQGHYPMFGNIIPTCDGVSSPIADLVFSEPKFYAENITTLLQTTDKHIVVVVSTQVIDEQVMQNIANEIGDITYAYVQYNDCCAYAIKSN